MKVVCYRCDKCNAVIINGLHKVALERLDVQNEEMTESNNPYPFNEQLSNIHLCTECAEDLVEELLGGAKELKEFDELKKKKEPRAKKVSSNKVAPGKIGTILALNEAGWSVDDIGKEVKVSPASVYRYIKKYKTVANFHAVEGISNNLKEEDL